MRLMDQVGAANPRAASRTRWVAIASVACGVLIAGGFACQILPPGTPPPPVDTGIAPIILAQDHILSVGSPPLTVFEYGDFQCPACGRFARETFPTIKQNYIDTGRIRWIFRHFPLRNQHPQAEKAAQGSECANDQSQFWPFHDMLYDNQAALSIAQLKAVAGQLGMDQATFDACIDSDAKAARVQTDVLSGQTLGVSATPTFFIGTLRVSGHRTVEQFSELLDDALEGLE